MTFNSVLIIVALLSNALVAQPVNQAPRILLRTGESRGGMSKGIPISKVCPGLFFSFLTVVFFYNRLRFYFSPSIYNPLCIYSLALSLRVRLFIRNCRPFVDTRTIPRLSNRCTSTSKYYQTKSRWNSCFIRYCFYCCKFFFFVVVSIHTSWMFISCYKQQWVEDTSFL